MHWSKERDSDHNNHYPSFRYSCFKNWSSFTTLVGRYEDGAPVIGWNQQLRVEDHASHIRLEHLDDSYLFHRQPGDVVDQLLFGLVICLHAGSIVLIYISRCQR